MKACYPGTFDPITYGHLDIIQRASRMFDEVAVLIMVNPRKQCLFTEEERIQMIYKGLQEMHCGNNVTVMVGNGLTVDFARKINAGVIIRGIRAVSDYEYELQQATANMLFDEDIETLFFVARPQYSFLSSSVVKEIALNGGDISKLLPKGIKESVEAKMKQQ